MKKIFRFSLKRFVDYADIYSRLEVMKLDNLVKGNDMTRKHFQLVADVMKAYVGSDDHVHICRSLASEFAEINPNFDNAKFMQACGYSVTESNDGYYQLSELDRPVTGATYLMQLTEPTED